jgi:CheY-like chemotaxis protein
MMTCVQGPLPLVVDPDPSTRKLYAAILASIADEIDYAEDGRDALAKAIGQPPRLVITETRLPFIDGYALCSLLRAEPLTADVPIVVVTGDADAIRMNRARESGADTVLIKPCLPETLLCAIARGRDRSVKKCDAQQAGPIVPSDSSREASRPLLVRAHQRFETTTPPRTPPPLRCPSCDQPLQYVRSHIGGVSARNSEQWDYYACTGGCGSFQYRQRTRRLRLIV